MSKHAIDELLKRTLVVVAHPDDEAVGAGALMQRMDACAVTFCTDGGPRDNYFWQRYGSRENYARLRREEAGSAARAVGVERLIFVPAVDQELHLNLADAYQVLENSLLEFQPDALLTLAYEGGHPDHDCCAFLSSALAKAHEIPVWEMPLYYRTREGIRKQEFIRQEEDPHRLTIDETGLSRKKEAVMAYKSQGGVVDAFDLGMEIFRPQPQYDFSKPPNDIINYEVWEWTVKAAEVCRAFTSWTGGQRSQAER